LQNYKILLRIKMPLFKTIIPKNNTEVYIWKITESIDDLNTVYLTQSSLQRVQNMKSELHQRGFLSVRHLLQKAGYTDADLYYTDNGKPHLKDGRHISISHSFTFSGIIVSDEEVGIDIEKNREKIKIIAHKFVNKEQDLLTDHRLVDQLTIVWGAKESLYKIYPYDSLSFKKHIDVDVFSLNASQTTAWIKSEDWDKKYTVFYQQFEGFTLVYAFSFYHPTND